MEDSQPAQENGRGVKKKKNMNSNASVMYIHVPCIVYCCCVVYLYISEKPPR
jgi:hypothetical protein